MVVQEAGKDSGLWMHGGQEGIKGGYYYIKSFHFSIPPSALSNSPIETLNLNAKGTITHIETMDPLVKVARSMMLDIFKKRRLPKQSKRAIELKPYIEI